VQQVVRRALKARTEQGRLRSLITCLRRGQLLRLQDGSQRYSRTCPEMFHEAKNAPNLFSTGAPTVRSGPHWGSSRRFPAGCPISDGAPYPLMCSGEKYSVPFPSPFDACCASASSRLENFLQAPVSTDAFVCLWVNMRHMTSLAFKSTSRERFAYCVQVA